MTKFDDCAERAARWLALVLAAALVLGACNGTKTGDTPLPVENEAAALSDFRASLAATEAALSDFRASLAATEAALSDLRAPAVGRSQQRTTAREAVASARKDLGRVRESLERPQEPVLSVRRGYTEVQPDGTLGFISERRKNDNAVQGMLAAVDTALAAIDAALARVSTPLAWEQLRKTLDAAQAELNNVKRRLAQVLPSVKVTPVKKYNVETGRELKNVKKELAEGTSRALSQAESTLSAARDSLVPLRLLAHVRYFGECNRPRTHHVSYLCAVDNVSDRRNELLKPVIEAIQGEMSVMGFSVFDETTITVGGRFISPMETVVQKLMKESYNRTIRTPNEILKICRFANESLDIAAIFTIRPTISRTRAGVYVSGKIGGQMLDCRSGSRLGGAPEQDFNKFSAQPEVAPAVIIKEIAEHAKDAGRQVASALANELVPGRSDASSPVANDSRGGNRFTLIFSNFTKQEIGDLEKFLKIFNGYRSHHLVNEGQTRQRIEYETLASSVQLRGQLNRMLKNAGIDGGVTLSGNIFRVQKI